MSVRIHGRVNRGAYDRPFSGVGIEYDPLGIEPGRSGVTLHETGFLERNPDWNFPGTYSPFWRLYYNAARGHCVLFGERMIELVPGKIMLIPPHCLFHSLGANPVPHLWLTFTFARKLRVEIAPPILLKARDTELCLIRDLKRLILAHPGPEPCEAVYRNSMALLQTTLARSELRWQPPITENLARVLAHIEGRLASKFSMHRLARLAGMSIAGFNRAFRRQTGTSPARHVMEMRVREAARLLTQGDATIDAIAGATGFPNRAYFSRVFKKATGESPARFRRIRRLS